MEQTVEIPSILQSLGFLLSFGFVQTPVCQCIWEDVASSLRLFPVSWEQPKAHSQALGSRGSRGFAGIQVTQLGPQKSGMYIPRHYWMYVFSHLCFPFLCCVVDGMDTESSTQCSNEWFIPLAVIFIFRAAKSVASLWCVFSDIYEISYFLRLAPSK